MEQGRAVVTNNFADFVTLHEEYVRNNRVHYGIIFTTKYSLPILIRRLRRLLESVSQDHMVNQIRWLNEFD